MATNSLKRPGEEQDVPDKRFRGASLFPVGSSTGMEYTKSMFQYNNKAVEVKIESVEGRRSSVFPDPNRPMPSNLGNPSHQPVATREAPCFVTEGQFRKRATYQELPICAPCRDGYHTLLKQMRQRPEWGMLSEGVKIERIGQARVQVTEECSQQAHVKNGAPKVKTRQPKAKSAADQLEDKDMKFAVSVGKVNMSSPFGAVGKQFMKLIPTMNSAEKIRALPVSVGGSNNTTAQPESSSTRHNSSTNTSSGVLAGMPASERRAHVTFLTAEYHKSKSRSIANSKATSASTSTKKPPTTNSRMILAGITRMERLIFHTSESWLTYFTKINAVTDALEKKNGLAFSVEKQENGDIQMLYNRELYGMLKAPMLLTVEKEEAKGEKKEKPIKIEEK